jgi:hypothetical protein
MLCTCTQVANCQLNKSFNRAILNILAGAKQEKVAAPVSKETTYHLKILVYLYNKKLHIQQNE